MTSTTTRRREKEVVAVAFNQKEQRVLEKSLATLHLEMNYSLKLLDLHNRSVKVHFRQMKDRVARIKSFLTQEEIGRMRKLDAEGKLPPMFSTVSVGGALKIAAAARRLGSAPAPGLRPARAVPDVNTTTHTRPGCSSSPSVKLKRSNSVTGVFIDAPPHPPHPDYPRPGSALGTFGESVPTPGIKIPGGAGRNFGAASNDHSSFDSSQDKRTLQVSGARNRACSAPAKNAAKTVTTSGSRGHQHDPSNGVSLESVPSRPAPPRTAEDRLASRSSAYSSHFRSSASLRPLSSFSSHATSDKECGDQADETARGRHQTPKSTRGSDTCVSSLSAGLTVLSTDDSGDSGLGEDPYAERRAELLEEEHFRSREITRRKNAFLKDVDRFLREHPPATSTPRRLGAASAGGALLSDGADFLDENQEIALNGAATPYRRRRAVKVDFDSTPTYLPEENYKERLMGLWKDMNKCRYLRIPEELIDLSGITTLASENMKLFQILRTRHPEPLSEAWKE